MRSHLPEKIYLSSPVWLQNLLVSVYGVMEHRRRYAGLFDETCNTLEKTEFLKQHELQKFVDSRLFETLERALTEVPHYRRLTVKKPVLTDFPVLDRSTVANNPEDFVSDAYNKSKLLTIFTGGSTGTPLKIYISKSVRQQTYAFWSRFYRTMDFRIGEKKASFVGRKVQDPDNNHPPFWRYNVIDRQLVFSSFHLTEENLPSYIKKLNQFKPKLIEGYPLSILRLAEYIRDNRVALSFKPVGLSTSSENFTSEQRKTMENAFDCGVFDQYGSAESVVFAGECEHGTMHIAPEYGVVEVLTKSGEIKSEGEGEFIVTTLLNHVMPLIRYRIGDLGKLGYKSCPCGRETAVIEELHGKVGATIVTEGRRVSAAAIAIAFEYIENIKKAQIVQNEPEKAIVKLVTKRDFTASDEDFMLWELQKMLGEKIQISVEYVKDIPPSENGKYNMVVQNFY
ncbi:phenylacetate-CoA ligase [Tamilnaduibacter salinus]|uniref:Phenylacetate-CoA ligase n=1 Tax=Tamilnaduibacter salinus TaxID=1484056 RepID=A0A2U1CZS9_9GAMM|nr:phenylacetate--CoA ligase family protein [Tamilnaduibacter salinus]PVY78305.1 phenylacetate-CoA ligase [Tamilnaduibacter salinus]